MKIRITMLAGNWLEFEAPEGFHMPTFIIGIQASGCYFDGGSVFIPMHGISMIHHFDPETAGASPIVVGMTKQ